MDFFDFKEQTPTNTALVKRAAPAPSQFMTFGKRNHNAAPVVGGAERLASSWFTTYISGNPNRLIERDLAQVRALANNLGDYHDVIPRYRELCRNFVVGKNGMMMTATFPGGKKIMKLWAKEMARNVSVAGGQNLTDMAQQAMGNLPINGEVFTQIVITEDGFMLYDRDPVLVEETYSAEAPNGDRIVQSIEIGGITGLMPQGYWVMSRYRDDGYYTKKPIIRERIDAMEMVHTFRRNGLRLRGMPWLTPMLDTAARRAEFKDAYGVACQVAAAIPLAIQTTQQSGFGFMPQVSAGNQAAPAPVDQNMVNFFNVNQTMFMELPFGKELKGVDIKFPQLNPTAINKEFKMDLAMGAFIGYDTLTGDNTNSNYASARHGSITEKTYWENLQSFFSRNFYQPIYEAWIRYHVFVVEDIPLPASGDIRDLYDVSWTGPAFKSSDPNKDAQAWMLLLANNAITLKDISERMGYESLEEMLDQRAAEIQMCTDRGLSTVVVPKNPNPKEPLTESPADPNADPKAEADAPAEGDSGE